MEKKSSKVKERLKVALKLILTGLAIFLVFKKIDLSELLETTKSLQWIWLLPALLIFVLSKIFTALRLNLYFRNIGLQISENLNFKLYSIGMFYNLFLPGGIGGDGYKIYLLNKHYKTPVKALIQASLLDRLSGLVSIIFLILLFAAGVNIVLPFEIGFRWQIFALAASLLVFPIFWFIQKLLFKAFLPSFLMSNIWSMLGQVSQLICAWFILMALGVKGDFIAYQFVFLLSSIVAVLPLTIGGVGARELVFIYAHTYTGINESTAVAFSLIFFLISALVSLFGVLVKVDLAKAEN